MCTRVRGVFIVLFVACVLLLIILTRPLKYAEEAAVKMKEGLEKSFRRTMVIVLDVRVRNIYIGGGAKFLSYGI